MIDYFSDFAVTNINAITERNCEQWSVKNLSFSNSYVMVLCLSGKAEYTLSDNSILSIKENNLFLFPPNNVRSGNAVPDDPWHFISVNFDILNLNGNGNDIINALSHGIDSVPELIRIKFKKLSLLWKEKKYMYKLKCRILIEEILSELLDMLKNNISSHSHLREIEKVSEFLHHNFTQNISIKDITSLHNLSETHFRKVFFKATGMSVKEYLIKLRLEYAVELLTSGEYNITETAILAGFNDVYYFSSLFKKKYGYSPSKLTKSVQKTESSDIILNKKSF